MRLIDADALEYSRVRIFYGLMDDGTPMVGGFNAVVMSCAIREAPTVDAVEVVRCKDCKHYNTSSCSDGFGWCEEMNAGWSDSDFCSYGERRDDG